MHIRDRHLKPLADEAMRTFPAMMLLGARQVGKSTLTHLLDLPHARYTTLDDVVTLSSAREDPIGFVTSPGSQTLVIDELQRYPELLLEIKASIDRDRRPGRFLLTGSADLLRLERTPDSLAGRAILMNLEGFSQGELRSEQDDFISHLDAGGLEHSRESVLSRADYAELLVRGGFPEVQELTARSRRLWFNSYLTQAVQHDARDAIATNQPERLSTVLRVIAARQGGELVKSHLASNADLPASTVTLYLDALSRLYLTYLLPPWTNNSLKRVTGKPKAGIRDVGLTAHLLGATSERLTSLDSPHMGGLLESFVVTELLKQQGWSDSDFTLSHYRDSMGGEIDIIAELADGRVWGLEVKATQTPRSEHFTHLKKLKDRIGDRFRGGIVLNMHPRTVRMGPGFWSMPVSALWDH
jgi:ATPase of the AAA superfamily